MVQRYNILGRHTNQYSCLCSHAWSVEVCHGKIRMRPFGDADPKGVNALAQYIHEFHPQFHVAWYSGRLRIPSIVNKSDFDYIKVGPYIQHLGPLKSPTTNQRMYRLKEDGSFEDITYRFWRKPAGQLA